MAKWIEFRENSDPKKKTRSFLVLNKDDQRPVGRIKWYPAFRQYSFFPFDNTVYERQCLIDITRFIHRLMIERKIKSPFVSKH